MEQLVKKIAILKEEIAAFNAGDAEAFRIKYLGTKGLVKTIMAEMKNVAAENKKEAGQLLNEFKIFTETKYDELNAASAKPEIASPKSPIDLTLPGDALPLGSRHPISLVKNKITSIFQRLGFAVAEGPEIEDDFHNFSALNLPQNHPARDMQDTFYISQNPDWLLRTHTSSVQVREMQKASLPDKQGKLPLRIICPGRVYRNETISARAHCFFHQVEGLYRKCLPARMTRLDGAKMLRFVFAPAIFLLLSLVPRWISVV
jgi:phenylalanyl-tRNA synthetase alpha chain